MHDLLIIGAGPAGMMAGICAAQRHKKVLILEKTGAPGHKLFLCGKKRCNVTNAEENLDQFALNYIRGKDFMRHILEAYSNQQFMRFLKEAGVNLKTEPRQRVFPSSNRSREIVDVLVNKLKDLKVEMLFHKRVTKLILQDKKVLGVEVEKEKFFASNVLVASGGKTKQKTGSSGDGYDLARQVGHTIIFPRKAHYPFEIAEIDPCKKLDGLVLKDAQVVFSNQGQEVFRSQGELRFSYFGLWGPLMEEADKNIHPGRTKNLQIILEGFNPADVKRGLKKEFQDLIFKGLTFSVVGVCLVNKSVVTDGGVALPEIDWNTCGSKLCENLFFAGEVLDVTGKTGGFNLQAAWSTGYIVGNQV